MNQFHSSLDLYHRNKGRRATVPETPFLLLAKRIPPMYWRLFQGVTLDSRMGYTGRRQFHRLGQAIDWAKSSVGDSWSNKRFHKPVGLDVLLACTASKVPEHLVEELKRRGSWCVFELCTRKGQFERSCSHSSRGTIKVRREYPPTFSEAFIEGCWESEFCPLWGRNVR
nr:hypothetical protein LOCMHKOF_00119 [Providencia stuartii]